MMRSKRWKGLLTAVLLLLIVGVMSACGAAVPTPATNETETNENDSSVAAPAVMSEEGDGAEEAYPAATAVLNDTGAAEEAYPPAEAAPPTETPLPESYPAAADEVFLEPRFQFDGPLTAGSTEVSGQAPPGLPVAIADITYNGTVLGTGVSDENGRFTIPVTPLIAGNRVGITFSQIPAGRTINEMSEEYYPYRGENFSNVPNVGIFFETALVQ